MSELSSQDIEHLGRLTRLHLTAEERERFAPQLSTVVGYIEQLADVDTTGVSPMHGHTGTQNVLAADTLRADDSLANVSREALLAGAPRSEKGFFVVKAVLDGGGGA